MFKTYKDFIKALQSNSCLDRVLAIEQAEKQVKPQLWKFFIVATAFDTREIKNGEKKICECI